MGRQSLGTHMEYRETFLQIQQRFLQHLIRRSRTLGSLMDQNTRHHMWWVRSQTPVQDQRCQSGPSAKNSVITSERGFFKELWSRPTTTADLRSSFRQVHHASNICLLEDKIQDWGMYLFTTSYGSYAVDQRSGVGWFSGWSKIFVLCQRNLNARMLKYSMRGLLQHWTESSIIQNSKERSVWRNKKLKKRTVSFVEDRSLTWSTSTSGSLESNDSVENCADLFTYCSSKWWYAGNQLEMGMEIYYLRRKSHLMTTWKDCTSYRIRESEKLRTGIGIVQPGDSSEESRTWLSQIEDNGEKKYRARIYETGILRPETEIMKGTPWSRIRGQNSVDKEL